VSNEPEPRPPPDRNDHGNVPVEEQGNVVADAIAAAADDSTAEAAHQGDRVVDAVDAQTATMRTAERLVDGMDRLSAEVATLGKRQAAITKAQRRSRRMLIGLIIGFCFDVSLTGVVGYLAHEARLSSDRAAAAVRRSDAATTEAVAAATDETEGCVSSDMSRKATVTIDDHILSAGLAHENAAQRAEVHKLIAYVTTSYPQRNCTLPKPKPKP
jgi:hypothetical protein